MSGQEAGDLDVSLLYLPLPGPAGAATRLALVVDIGGESLLDGAAEDDFLVTEVYAYALNGAGGLSATLTQAFRLDLKRQRDALASGGVKFFGHLDLAPGEYSLRVLVLRRSSGRLRLRVTPVSVPSWDGPVLAPPLFPESPASWILVHEQSPDGRTPLFPIETAGRVWVPATKPRAGGGDTPLYLIGRGLAAGLRAHVAAAEGGEVLSELGLGDLRPVAEAPAGVEMLSAEIRTAGLAAGEHLLQVFFAAADGAGTVDASVPPEGDRRDIPLAASIPLTIPPSEGELALRAELASAAGSEDPSARRGRARRTARTPRSRSTFRGGRNLELELARAAYAKAFKLLAAGDRSAGRLALIELEREIVGTELDDKTSDREQKLLDAQTQAALELVGKRGGMEGFEALIPLMWLHEQLYREYHQHGHFLLANHSRKLLFLFSETYLENRDSAAAREIVGGMTASLAGYLHEKRIRLGAAAAYESALEFDPQHRASLTGLAILKEESSQYEEAAELLQRLLEAQPENRQARLRLGVNRRRLGAKKSAKKLLRECIPAASETVTGAQRWPVVLAYQELAALHAAEQNYGEAVAVLEEAVERMPEQQRLYIQLAALLDRMGRPAQATAVLDRLDPRVEGDADSPRLLYAQMPAAEIARVRHLLDREAERRLPYLVEAASHDASARGPAGGD